MLWIRAAFCVVSILNSRGMPEPRSDFYLDGKSLTAMCVTSVAHWRLAGHLSFKFNVLWVIREISGSEVTYAFSPTEWSDRSFKSDHNCK